MHPSYLPRLSLTAALFALQALLCIAPTRAEDSALERAAHPGQVQIIDQQVGTGRTIARGAFAVLRYTGWLYEAGAPDHKGKQFASLGSPGKSLTFVYGYKRVLPGLEKGLAGMRVGGRRTIIVPPKLRLR